MCTQSSLPLAQLNSHAFVNVQDFSAAETVLVVEDEIFVRKVTCEVLRSAGYHVMSAGSAAEALRACAQHRCHLRLLLTDVVLPDETGCALAAKLAAANHDLRVLLVSGYAKAVACEVEGAEYLPKPYSSEALLGKVRQLLHSNNR